MAQHAHDADSLTQSTTEGLRDAVKSWNRFWFHPASPTPLGLVRICCGVLVLYTHLLFCYDLQELFGASAWVGHDLMTDRRHNMPTMAPPDDWKEPNRPLMQDAPDPMQRLGILESLAVELKVDPAALSPDKMVRLQELERAYIDYVDENSIDPRRLKNESPREKQRIVDYARKNGVDPRDVYSKGASGWSLWYHLTDPTWMSIAHGLILVVMLLFTLGFATRITSVLTWLAAVSYIQRSPPTLFGQDTMMNILLLYLMIGPSGAALSLDRLLLRWWARRRGVEAPSEPAPLVSANFCIRLIQVHLCFIYLASGLSKLLGTTWWSGIATWLTMANYSFAP